MNEVEKLAEIFKVLSDPTRLRLIRLLNECSSGEDMQDKCCGGTLCVNALAKKLGVTQSAVSQHLRILRQVGLVRGERRGSFIHYAIDPEGLSKCKTALLDALGEDFSRD